MLEASLSNICAMPRSFLALEGVFFGDFFGSKLRSFVCGTLVCRSQRCFGCILLEDPQWGEVWKTYANSNDLGEFALPTSHGAGDSELETFLVCTKPKDKKTNGLRI